MSEEKERLKVLQSRLSSVDKERIVHDASMLKQRQDQEQGIVPSPLGMTHW